MTPAALAASADLEAELAANENPYVDPRSLSTRFSLLKLMSLSPAHYREGCQRDQDGTSDSLALRLGSGSHAMLFGKPVVRFDGKVRSGKVWDAFAAEHADAVILNRREWSEAVELVEAIRRNRAAMLLLFDDTRIESRIDWSFVGRACRSTPDARARTRIVDLKTAESAEPRTFIRKALRFFYHAQAALYLDAAEAHAGERPSDAYVIAVEKSRPHPVSILRFTDRALELGAMHCRAWIERLIACEAADQWPEYLEDVGDFDIDGSEELALEFNGRRIEVR